MLTEALGSPVPVALQLALVGLAAGALLGAASRITDFCTLGALETAIFGGDTRRLHIWGIALGVAILGTQAGAAAGLVDLPRTIYHALAWSPAASVAGGLVFGYGMALAGNCGFGAALRAGSGDIRSFILLLVIGISTHATLSGPLAPLRTLIFPQHPASGPQGLADGFAAATGLPGLLPALAIGLALVVWGLRHPAVAGSPAAILGAAGVGLAVVASLAGTSRIADGGLGAVLVEGPSFTAPVGRTIIYLMTATGTPPSHSVGLVLGTILGAFLVVSLRGEFRWEACEDPRELGRQLWGAALMGVGGAVAMGCTIGQGLTAVATLAWSGPVTLAAIAAGAYVGLQRMLAQPEG